MKFCPKCGATDKDFYKGFCVDCYRNMNKFAEVPKRLKIIRCKDCGFWFYKGAWIEDSYHHLARIISEKVKTALFEPRFEVALKDDLANLTLSGFADENKAIPVTVKEEIKLSFEERTCDSCAKFNSKNHEFKIQLRGSEPFDAIKYKKLADAIKKQIEYLTRKDERARAFWIEEKKEGLDFLFGFRQAGEDVVHYILGNFKAKHEVSSESLGFDKDGKRKIRVTYCIRI